MDIRKDLFTEKEISHWTGLPREVMKSLLLEVFRRYVAMTLRDMV